VGKSLLSCQVQKKKILSKIEKRHRKISMKSAYLITIDFKDIGSLSKIIRAVYSFFEKLCFICTKDYVCILGNSTDQNAIIVLYFDAQNDLEGYQYDDEVCGTRFTFYLSSVVLSQSLSAAHNANGCSMTSLSLSLIRDSDDHGTQIDRCQIFMMALNLPFSPYQSDIDTMNVIDTPPDVESITEFIGSYDLEFCWTSSDYMAKSIMLFSDYAAIQYNLLPGGLKITGHQSLGAKRDQMYTEFIQMTRVADGAQPPKDASLVVSDPLFTQKVDPYYTQDEDAQIVPLVIAQAVPRVLSIFSAIVKSFQRKDYVPGSVTMRIRSNFAHGVHTVNDSTPQLYPLILDHTVDGGGTMYLIVTPCEISANQ